MPHSSGEIFLWKMKKCYEKFKRLKTRKKEKWRNNGMNSQQQRYLSVFLCNKFQISRPHSSWEKCDEKFYSLKIGEKEKWKKGWISRSSSSIVVYMIHPPLFMCVPSFNFLGLTIPERSARKFLMFENWRERWMDKLGFYIPSTVFQSFRDDGRVNMKGSV